MRKDPPYELRGTQSIELKLQENKNSSQNHNYGRDEFSQCARGGTRTHTPKNLILSQARLPIPPLGLVLKGTHKILPYRLAENRITKSKKYPQYSLKPRR